MGYLRENEAAQIAQEVIDRFLIPHFLELGMEATGEWRSNLGYRIDVNTEGVTINFRGRQYTDALVNGTPAGTKPSINQLTTWVQAKLHISYPNSIRTAYAVQSKIEAEGTEYYKQGGTDLLEVLQSDEVTRFVRDRVNALILPRMTLDIQRKIHELAWD